MILSQVPDTTEDMEHPWTGLSKEDLTIDYPMTSQCAGLGHPILAGNWDECICGDYYQRWDGVKRAKPDPSDYRDDNQGEWD